MAMATAQQGASRRSPLSRSCSHSFFVSHSAERARAAAEALLASGGDGGPASDADALEQHERRWAAFQAAPPACIRAASVPWPPMSASRLLAVSAAQLLRAGGAADAAAALRCAFREAARRWHPDRFMSRFGPALAEEDRAAVVERVNHFAAALNDEVLGRG